MNPTIRDVADLAGVSFQLVAAVLAGKKYARASEATRKRIFEAAERLGYVPSVSARILKGGESKVLGVLVDSRAPDAIRNLLAEIEMEADRAGYCLLVAQAHNNPEKLLKSYYSLKQFGVDGILSLAHDYPFLHSDLGKKLQEDNRLVFILNTSGVENCSVDVDIESAMKQALDHFKAQQYRKAALLLYGDENTQDSLFVSCRKRMEGFRKYAPDGEIFFVPDLRLEPEKTAVVYRHLAKTLLDAHGVDCVIAQNDYGAAALLRELLKCGKRVPEDIGLIGWDNLIVGECTAAALTSFCYDRRELAQSAVSLLLSRIRGEEENQKIKLSLKMILRESSQRK